MTASSPTSVIIGKRFDDGRYVVVVESAGRALARVYTARGNLYLEHEYLTAAEATETVILWNGEGYPLSQRQRGA
jgi:hypothetical protein